MKYVGLSSLEAKHSLDMHGPNQIQEQKQRGLLMILRNQIKGNFMIYFMVFAAILSFSVGKMTTGYAILGVIFIIIIVGFFQEYKAERAVSALKKMLKSFSTVLRDGKEMQIPSVDLVPGDIVLLETGEKVPADCIILESNDMMLNESILTGESKEIHKISAKNLKEPLDSQTLLYMGTYILNGRGIVQVLKTGMETEFGKIASMISQAEKELPLLKKVNYLAKFMATIAIIVSVSAGALMLFNIESRTNDNLVNILLIVIALMISAFPEGLPVVMISTLAGGAYRMAKKKAIVSRMSIIETLGETTVICSDKTGTITKGEMMVKELFTYKDHLEITGTGYDTQGNFLDKGNPIDPQKESLVKKLLYAATLCNNSHKISTQVGMRFKGTPTEIALMVVGHKANIIEDIVDFERIEELPFSSERKMMSVIVKQKENNILYIKGAPEIFLKHCTHIQINDKIEPLSLKHTEHIQQKITDFADKKYRVLCLGYKIMEKNENGIVEEDIIFLGAVGLQDSPREGVQEAIESCYAAGIKVKMITGDNKQTAIAIAKDVGIVGEAVSGEELDEMSDQELKERVNNIVIFARVKPEHKIRIVKALKELGEIVTMTGDGVNDAPALKEAHIGVAMGINGTDVSREAADLILEDDNFVTIVSAIKEGRTIFKNIQKFVIYQLSCNIAELSVVFVSVLFGMPSPLVALQILFMNLVTDNLPALTLGFTDSSKHIMNIQARKSSKILNGKKKGLMIGVGLYMGITAFLVYVISTRFFHRDIATASSLVLLTLIMFEITNAFNFRSLYTTFFRTHIKRNVLLIWASIISLGATIAIIYIPGLQRIFETKALPWQARIFTFIFSLSIILLVDGVKIYNKYFSSDYAKNK